MFFYLNLLKSASVIDIHCHILPEVDDGPKSWEIAEGMCRMAAKDGIEHMVATPHANDRYYYDRAYLLNLLEQLQLRVGPTPQLSLGCDFHLSYENTQAAMQTPERWCIANTRYLLVEFNNFSIPQPLDDWLASMCEREIFPIIKNTRTRHAVGQLRMRSANYLIGADRFMGSTSRTTGASVLKETCRAFPGHRLARYHSSPANSVAGPKSCREGIRSGCGTCPG